MVGLILRIVTNNMIGSEIINNIIKETEAVKLCVMSLHDDSV